MELDKIKNGKKAEDDEDEDEKWNPGDIEEDDSTAWKDLTTGKKILRVLISIFCTLSLFVLLYFFVCSLDLLTSAFRLLGSKATTALFKQSTIIKNPIVGVMIGTLTTVLVQSSSTSTSIVVTIVSASFIDIQTAIPIIFGCNIGTSITNTLVSLSQAGDRNQFRRAFSGATVHDMFNWLAVIVLLPLESSTHMIYHLTSAIVSEITPSNDIQNIEILSKVTKPLVNKIVQIDKKVLNCWSLQNCTKYPEDYSLIKNKEFCTNLTSTSNNFIDQYQTQEEDYEDFNSTIITSTIETPILNFINTNNKCDFIFSTSSLTDGQIGIILFFCSLAALATCLIFIVKILSYSLKGRVAKLIRKCINFKIPYLPFLSGYIFILVGCVLTFIIQSSSVFTSTLTPLVGIGIIPIEKVYPLTLGSNLGTTSTTILAALAADGSVKSFKLSLQIAFCHLFFNLIGILIFYPLRPMRWPIHFAKHLGNVTARYRWFAIAYMALMFFVLPLIFMGLSFIGTVAVIIFAALLVGLIAFVVIVNLLKKRKPSILPNILKSWNFIPEPLRSLAPYDRFFTRLAFCQRFNSKQEESSPEEEKEKKNNTNILPVTNNNLPRISSNNYAHDNRAFEL